MEDAEGSRSKRKRMKTSRFDFQFLDNEEQRLIQQAIKISKYDTKRVDVNIPEAPTFYPTPEEFADCMSYIRKIRPEAEKFGICKIVPPIGWNPTCQITMTNPHHFPTKLQDIHTLQQGQGFDDGKRYTIQSYQTMADKFSQKWMQKNHPSELMNLEVLAKDYWDIVETNQQKISVEYGNDLDTADYGSGFPRGRVILKDEEETSSSSNGSSAGGGGIGGGEGTRESSNDGSVTSSTTTSSSSSSSTSTSSTTADVSSMSFDDPAYYHHSSWNLNNVPSAPGSVLKYLKTPVNGINVPWLYIGMLFSSFCWHNEDNYFYSINYNHFGHTKQWYGVPGSAAELFEKVSKEFLMELFRETPDLLHHMTTQISPALLSVYKAAQEAKTFIITFPKAYHCGFSYGFNVGEAVNFATIDWLRSGGEAEERYRIFGRKSVFSHQRLLFTLLKNLESFEGGFGGLSNEINRIIDEEVNSRAFLVNEGVRDLSKVVTLPANDFTVVDKKATDYDDMRCCCVCKQVCVFSAVACECDRNKVSCLRHWNFMCKCPKEKKFLLAWASFSYFKTFRQEQIPKLGKA